MALVYRAIWQDDATGIHERAMDAFRWWVGKHSQHPRTFEAGIDEIADGTSTLVRRGDDANGSIQRCSLHVDNGTDRTTTTVITTTTPTAPASVWVDLERVSHRAFAAYQVRAPAVSTRLIANGVTPRSGPLQLSVKPRALRPGEIDGFVALLARRDRDLPVVVFTVGSSLDTAAAGDAAQHAARVLAGTAAVFLVSDRGRSRLGTLLGPELIMEPGGVRVYLPGLSPEEPDPWRHRLLIPEQVAENPRGVAHHVVQLLSPANAARRAPTEYETLRTLLQSGGTMAPEIDEHRIERIHDLEGQLEASEQQVLDLLVDLEEAEGRINDLQSRLVRILLDGIPRDGQVTGGPPSDVESCRGAAEAARAHLSGLVLPEAACRNLWELDDRLEGRTWGRKSWQAFLALNAFALDERFKPGFWEWCRAARSPLAWPANPKKLAMTESESILEDDSLRRHRVLPVDVRVDPAGRILMLAHLKIGGGGGAQIPRVYFHDDRHGVTGKVHIGFFGPHRLMPTANHR